MKTTNAIYRMLLKAPQWGILFMVLSLGLAQADTPPTPPTTISYQGFLTSASGLALDGVSYGIKVEIFESLGGGTAVYTESHSNVSVTKGRFALNLGAGASTDTWTTDVDFSKALWLQLTIDTAGANETLSPRVALSPVPYTRLALDVIEGSVTEDKLAATLEFDDGDLLNLSAINASGAQEGLILPQAADVSAATEEGQLGWDSDDDVLYVGTGESQTALVTTTGNQSLSNKTLVSTTVHGTLSLSNGTTSAGSLALYEASDEGNQKITIQAGAMTSDYSLTLPAADGSQGQFLITDGEGKLLWSNSIGKGVASGSNSFASGSGQATGVVSSALGAATASGQLSTAMGLLTTASGLSSTAMGRDSTASGPQSTAMGFSTTAEGSASTAMGNETRASGPNSMAIGNETHAQGVSSLALGGGTLAQGEVSMAGGHQTTAKGAGSVAMGIRSIALGDYSIAFGNGTTAHASMSLVGGQFNTERPTERKDTWVSSDSLFVLGNGTNRQNRSDALVILKSGATSIQNATTDAVTLSLKNGPGPGSIAIYEASSAGTSQVTLQAGTMASDYTLTLPKGDGASGQVLSTDGNGQLSWINNGSPGGDTFSWKGTPTGTSSVAMGDSSAASGNDAIALGKEAKAEGSFASAFGQKTTANGVSSLAMGSSSTANGNNSVAIGNFVSAVGASSLALGSSTTASGLTSTALGGSTFASAAYSTAMGFATSATGNTATAMGQNAIASGDYSTAMGNSIEASSYGSIVGGRYNTWRSTENNADWVDTDSLFVLGNGTSALNTSDALVVLKSGATTIQNRDTNSATLTLQNGLNPGSLALYEGGGNNYVTLQAGTMSLNYTLTLPSDDGASGQVLSTDGNGNLSWANSSSGGGGTATGTGSFATETSVASKQYTVAMGFDSEANNDYAIAIGNNVTAKGWSSVAIGNATTASGQNSIAMGFNSTAVGNNSVALGSLNNSEGDSSFTMGTNNNALGSLSTALGSGTTTWATRSVAMGNRTLAMGVNSIAFGNATTSRAFSSFVGGQYNTPRSSEDRYKWDMDDSLFVLGNGSDIANPSDAFVVLKSGATSIQNATTDTVTLSLKNGRRAGSLALYEASDNGSNHVVVQAGAVTSDFTLTLPGDAGTNGQVLSTDGNGNLSWASSSSGGGGTATGTGSFATGTATASGDYSVAMGANSEASGSQSFVAGNFAKATGRVAAAFGNGIATGGYSFVTGADSEAKGEFSAASGLNTTAYSYGSFVIGRNNAPRTNENNSNWVHTDSIFVIGNGSDSTFQDAFEVLKNGATTIINSTTNTATLSLKNSSDVGAIALYETPSAGTNHVAIQAGTMGTDYTLTLPSDDGNTGQLLKTDGSGNLSWVGGTASGNNSFATNGNTANGAHGTAFGILTEASGNHSIAMGNNTKATGAEGTAMGITTTASGTGSVSMGFETEASGKFSMATGSYTKAYSFNSIVGGQYNTERTSEDSTSWNAANSLFILGNGSSATDRSDAFVVLKNGNAILGGNLVENSDIRLKHNIQPLSNVLEKLIRLEGVTYEFKDTTTRPEGVHIGVVAQNIQKVFPELVSEDHQGYLSVAYDRLAPILLEGVKAQHTIIQEQQTKIEQQQAELQKHQSELNKIKAALAKAGIVID